MNDDSTALSHFFDPATWTRGEAYHRRGLVARLERDERGRAVSAEVEGTRPRPYSVFIEWGDDGAPAGDCDCPVGVQCKHVVAALLAGAEGGDDGAEAGQGSGTEDDKAWLIRLRGTVSTEEDGAASGQRLLYVAGADGDGGGLVVELCVGTGGKRLDHGGYLFPRGFTLRDTHLVQPPKLLRDSDLQLLRPLSRHGVPAPSRAGGSAWRVPAAHTGVLLEGMAATGRAHWDDPATAPLILGEPRPGRLVWRLREDGRQRPVFAVDGDTGAAAFVLAGGDCCRYVLDGAVGPLETGMPEALCTAVGETPWLDRDEASTFHESLCRSPGAHGLAAGDPSVLPEPHRLTARPVRTPPAPILRLGARRVPRYRLPAFHDVAEQIATAELRFRYEAQGRKADLPASEPEPRVERVAGGELLEIHRDPAEEARFAAELVEALPMLPGDFPFLPEGPDDAPRQLYAASGEAEWRTFLADGLPRLRAGGWRIEVDADFPLPVPREPEAWDARITEGDGGWFGIGLGVVVDGERIDLLPPLLAALRDLPPGERLQERDDRPDDGHLTVPLPDGRAVVMPLRRLRPLLATLVELYDRETALDAEGRLRLPVSDALRLHDLETAGWQWQGGERLRRLAERLARPLEPAAAPPDLAVSLRPYQATGLAWMRLLYEEGFGGVLADDMGLGKTLQTLAHLLGERTAGRADRPSLVVAPTSVLWNWRREAERFAPRLRVALYHGAGRGASAPEGTDLIVTSYALLRRDAEILAAREYHLVILDEAQQIKNPRAQTARAARRLRARQRLCLTGTPLENHLGELWSLFHFLMPGFLGDEKTFRRRYRRPIEEHGDPVRARALAARIRPFLLRRRKDQVAAELPAKTEIVRRVEMDEAQRDLYESVRLSVHEHLRRVMDDKGLARSRIEILDALLKLRQVCCDPRLVKVAAGQDERRAARRRAASAKLEALTGLVEELAEEGRRVLIFSQFTEMLALIENALRRLGVEWVALTGATRDREAVVERFQRGDVPVMLLSLKAGGTGLNLTAADTVIHYDPWWNPAAEAQATDRAHRIGQDRPVFVYRLICAGTVEERIQRLQAEKAELAAGVYGENGGEAGALLEPDDLAALLEPLEEGV